MKQWKELAVLSAGALLTIELAACGNTNHNSDNSSSKVSTTKIAKSSSKKSNPSSVMSSSSSSLSSSSSSNVASSSATVSSTQPAAINSAVAGFSTTNDNSKANNNQQNQVAQNTNNQNNNGQNNNVINTPQQAIQAAINKYGTNNGKWRWSCLVNGSFNNPQCKWLNGNPVNNDNPNGYFVVRNYLKNDPNSGDGGMISTYRVYPNGNIIQAGF